ncbi:Mitochondrial porin [Lathyrus oleraceus]|uniref:Mitochondrial porin n=1 Tax=Pisum sativum TaxID=3888 RepID=A0A9D4YD07_PEA|nr:Mitochondrial porin [Pisum sativum]
MITKPALEALKDRLMTENVAEEINEKLCESVTASEEKPDDNTYSSVNSAISIEDNTLTSQVSTSSCQLRKNSLPQITSSILLELPFHFQKISFGFQANKTNLTANPIVNLSVVIGTNVIALGHDSSYDPKTGELTKFDAGLNFTKDDLVASLVLNEKGNVLNASYYHVVNPFTKTAVGAK